MLLFNGDFYCAWYNMLSAHAAKITIWQMVAIFQQILIF